MGKHFGQGIIKDALRMKEEGLSHREIGVSFGLTKKQIKNLLERYRTNERKRAAGVLPRPKVARAKPFKHKKKSWRLRTSNSKWKTNY